MQMREVGGAAERRASESESKAEETTSLRFGRKTSPFREAEGRKKERTRTRKRTRMIDHPR